MGKIFVNVGDVFGDLTVIEAVESLYAGKPSTRCLCRCSCGAEVRYFGSLLRKGFTKTCGDHLSTKMQENYRDAKQRFKKYPSEFGARTRLYATWKSMVARCTKVSDKSYPQYGGRGISLCLEWANYENFMGWAIGAGYKETLTIDRIDNWKGYEPGNCRWATHRQQRHNQRRGLRTMEAFGETKSVADWVLDPRCRVAYNALLLRQKAGYPGATCLTALRLPLKSPEAKNA
jgi:hypothetical protein